MDRSTNNIGRSPGCRKRSRSFNDWCNDFLPAPGIADARAFCPSTSRRLSTKRIPPTAPALTPEQRVARHRPGPGQTRGLGRSILRARPRADQSGLVPTASCHRRALTRRRRRIAWIGSIAACRLQVPLRRPGEWALAIEGGRPFLFEFPHSSCAGRRQQRHRPGHRGTFAGRLDQRPS